MKTFYHGADGDGFASGAIVRTIYGENSEYIPYFLKDFPLDTIEKDEVVTLVDCSCDFHELLKITKNIFWIDHHKTAIDQYEGLGLHGLRRDGTAACELCWEYYYDVNQMPWIIKLLGDYDVWKFKYGDDSNRLQAGFRLYDYSITSQVWDKWLNPAYYPQEELDKGEIALQYRNNYYSSLVKSLSFMTEFEGYRAICCNAGSVSSQLFDTIPKETYDIMIPFSFNGNEWAFSIYSTNKEIDCGAIAKKYGGGGHFGAAGFRAKELPFKKI